MPVGPVGEHVRIAVQDEPILIEIEVKMGDIAIES
jgi:hypothetical protein